MFVLTVDQKNSRKGIDRVPELLSSLESLTARLDKGNVVLPFTRTVGDEVQGVVGNSLTALAVTRFLLRSGKWYVGIGIGSVDLPLPIRAPEASGSAFILARVAVEDAKVMRGSVPLSVRAEGGVTQRAGSEFAQAALRLIGITWQSRTDLAWQAVNLLVDDFGVSTGLTQREVADQIGVSSAAVSKRLKGAHLDEEQAMYPLLVDLLDQLDV